MPVHGQRREPGFRAQIIRDEQIQTRGRIASLRADFVAMVAASTDANVDDEHDPEGSTIAFERAQVSSLIRQAEEQLAELDAANRRLAAGTYGRCERCARPIAAARLEARPAARTCIDCA
jgi:DnaK suppressor protein